MLAGWFAACTSEADSHRLARAAFALNPARHYFSDPIVAATAYDLPATTPWADAPPMRIHPRLREYGEATPRSALPRVQERDEERRLLAAQFREEHAQIEIARTRLATGKMTRLSELGMLDHHAFELFLRLLGEALTAQTSPDQSVELQSSDGLLRIHLVPLDPSSHAEIRTQSGIFSGRDHVITITRTGEAMP